MRIVCLILRNWGPFRGEHVLDLGSKAYAVVAHRDGNQEASNGAGKTMFVEAVEFALYGRHRHRLEDDLITRGEPGGEVELHFDDGPRIVRSRKRGQSTRLSYVHSGGAAAQDGAQQTIFERVGLDADDYRNTAYLAQKQAHRLVTARPEERMQIVGGWLRLDRLEACADSVRSRMSEISHRRAQYDGQLRAAEDSVQRSLGGCADVAALEILANAVEEKLDASRAEMTDLQVRLEAVARAKLAQERARELGVITAEGMKFKAERDGIDLSKLKRGFDLASADARMVVGSVAEARRELEQKRSLAKGKFDGCCPVAGIECPVKDKINVIGLANQKLLHEALTRSEEAERRQVEAFAAERSATTALQAVTRLDDRLEGLREQARKLKAMAGPRMADVDPAQAPAIRISISALQDRLGALSAERGALLRAVSDCRHAQDVIQAAKEDARKAEVELATYRAAAQVFGRNGAQRRVAERALSQIEMGANELLSECGADLRVAVSWAREGSGPAKACEACGAAFPASAKVKVCERCNTPRGPHLVQKLEVELSDRSGGLEDLAGIALQTAAWRWLRSARGSAWGVMILDEPVAALDRSLRKAFTSHLARMLTLGGAEQSLVIAHSSDVLESLPGKILVTNDGGDARAEVVT